MTTTHYNIKIREFDAMNKKIKIKNIMMLSILLFASSTSTYSSADEITTTQVGRYVTVNNTPISAQIDLLTQTIQVHFPQTVQSVGDAINYILRLSGYSLVPADEMTTPLKVTLSKPLPAIDRNIGPMSLNTALIVLAGHPFSLIDDPINRTVNFHLKKQYQPLNTKKQSFN